MESKSINSRLNDIKEIISSTISLLDTPNFADENKILNQINKFNELFIQLSRDDLHNLKVYMNNIMEGIVVLMDDVECLRNFLYTNSAGKQIMLVFESITSLLERKIIARTQYLINKMDFETQYYILYYQFFEDEHTACIHLCAIYFQSDSVLLENIILAQLEMYKKCLKPPPLDIEIKYLEIMSKGYNNPDGVFIGEPVAEEKIKCYPNDGYIYTPAGHDCLHLLDLYRRKNNYDKMEEWIRYFELSGKIFYLRYCYNSGYSRWLETFNSDIDPNIIMKFELNDRGEENMGRYYFELLKRAQDSKDPIKIEYYNVRANFNTYNLDDITTSYFFRVEQRLIDEQEKNNKLHLKIESLETELYYRPDGDGAQKHKDNFYSTSDKLKEINK